ncbi:MAG: hypothetical protein F9K19_06315 [Rhizobiaceae bacterium]|nr:MAG: hypothetical protein F9K19_06315 [Rhizobiaceae bacterium]CAG1016062.1 glyoxylate reductase [Rhizobiaceae bacterium]
MAGILTGETAGGGATAPLVGFLDEDHVIRLARALLHPDDAAMRAYVTGFFAPEAIAEKRWARMCAGLEQATHSPAPLGGGTEAVRCVVFRRGNIDRTFLAAHPNLRLIQRLGARPVGIDIGEATWRGIQVSCMPRPSLAAVAEHCLMLMLAVSKKLIQADACVRRGGHEPGDRGQVAYNWPGIDGIGRLWGKTLGIVGMGEVGLLVAERAKAFGMRILYFDDNPLPPELDRELNAEPAALPALCEASDFVSVHVPASPRNGAILGRREFEMMKPTVIIINTSRGSVLDEEALTTALLAGRLGGAALDVHQHEPRPVDAFCAMENVVLTPHLAAGSRLGVLDEIEMIFDNLRAVGAGRRAIHAVVEPRDRP